MKTGCFYTILMTLFLSSCVWDETLVTDWDAAKEVQAGEILYQSEPTDNLLVVGEDKAVGSRVDWQSDWTETTEDLALKEENTWLCAYDGEGGEFIVHEGLPAVRYIQQGEWVESGFHYAMADNNTFLKNSGSLDFKNAFGNVRFRISNKVKSLHLQVTGIKLCNVYTGGSFLFPGPENQPYWTDMVKDTLGVTMDTLQIGPSESMEFPEDGKLPVIPQKTHPWNTISSPGESGCSYLLLNCRIFNILNSEQGYQEGHEVPVWCGSDEDFAELAIPVSLHLQCDETVTIDLTLENGCEWYVVRDGWTSKVLQPIIFDVEVEDWENE